jgi:flagellar protein FlbD
VIKLHKPNGTEIVINAEFIETIEPGPDTKIVLTTGKQFIVKENSDYVIEKIKEYKQNILEHNVKK